MDSNLSMGGKFDKPQLIKAAADPYAVKQVRLPFGLGRIWLTRDPGMSVLPGNLMLATNLQFHQFNRQGKLIEMGDLGSGLVTNAGVNYMAADFLAASSARINAFNYHDSGTGVTAEAVTQTVLVTQAGPATRATGTQSNPSANIYQSVGTIAYTSTLAITEWGLFNQAAQGGTLWDRRVFSAVNVANGDSVQFTYRLTVNSGG